MAEDGHHLHADNPNCVWFDESYVPRGADRIAFTLGVVPGSLAKSAGMLPMGGAALAEELGVGLSPSLIHDPTVSPSVARAREVAFRLRDKEAAIRLAGADPWDDVLACQPAIVRPPAVDYALVCAALARRKVALDVGEFLGLLAGGTDASDAVPDVAARVPGAVDRLIKSADFEDELASSPFVAPARETYALSRWADDVARDRALTKSAWASAAPRVACTVRRPARIGLPGASLDDATGAEALARHYALYKIALLAAVRDDDPDRPLVEDLAARQHVVR